MKTNLDLYVNNTRDIYAITERLAANVAKRMKRGEPVTVEYLAECATMKRIISYGATLCAKYGEQVPDRQEKKFFASVHARYIIEEIAPYM